jgi:6-phosphogluconolactonase (cycloisomerase 2 family)
VDGLNSAVSVVVSPDGNNVYVAGNDDDAVAVFDRNSTTGELTFVEFHEDGVGGVDYLNGARALAMKPNGVYLHVASYEDDSLTTFVRDGNTGELFLFDVERDSVNGVNGLNGASCVASSPDGKHIYVTGQLDNAVALFEWQIVGYFSVPVFIDSYVDNSSGVTGLKGARSVVVSPDGRHVYAAGEFESAVQIFDRNRIDGTLTPLGEVRDGVGGVDGLYTMPIRSPSVQMERMYL